MTFKRQLEEAAEYLKTTDPVLAPVILSTGSCTIAPHNNYYWELIDSIISQQLSIKAAASIEKRFRELFKDNYPEPQAILNKSIEELRSVGLSQAKAKYIRDLAVHIKDGRLRFDKLDQQSNDDIIAELTDIKGIGVWTAHMFLIFCMGRLDILPVGDLGIRNGIRKLYGFSELPTPKEIEELAIKRHWHPYESVASWYIWQSLSNQPAL